MSELQYTSLPAIDNKYASVLNGFHSGLTLPLEFRRQQLRNLYFAVIDNEDLLKRALVTDLHRSESETEILEINLILTEIVVAIKNLEDWAADVKLPVIPHDIRYAAGQNVLRKTPYGTVLIIGPWNYPYLCTIAPIVSALAAGNTVLLKPTEVATESSKALSKVLESALSPDVVQVVLGGVKETTHLLEKNWDKIMLTGSNNVGKIVARAAADKLTPLTLELGGKSPAIISRKANLKLAAKRIAWAKFVNAGQTCIAPDYIIIDADVADEFSILLQAFIKQLYPTLSTNNESSDFAHIVSSRLWERAVKLVDETKGQVWQLGEANKETLFFPPTVVRGVTSGDSLMESELFNPIIPILEVENAVQEAPGFVSSEHDYPLALYIFSTDKREHELLLSQTRSGAVMINDAIQQGGSSIIPFGGVGASGQGRYHGKYGFDEFTYERPVVVQPNWAEFLLNGRYPPYKSHNVALLRHLSRPNAGLKRTGKVGGRSFFGWLFSFIPLKWDLILVILLALYYR